MQIEISVEELDPPKGSVVADGGEAIVFAGWMDLLRVLSQLLEGKQS